VDDVRHLLSPGCRSKYELPHDTGDSRRLDTQRSLLGRRQERREPRALRMVRKDGQGTARPFDLDSPNR
jgi:hypothetical protein